MYLDEELQKEIAANAGQRLNALEQNVSENAERIVKKLEQRAAALQKWEKELQVKQEELSLLQNKIDACEEKMKGLEEAEQRLSSYQQILAQREQEMQAADSRNSEAYQQRFDALEQSFREKGEQHAKKLEEYNRNIEDVLQRENNIAVSEQTLESELNVKRSQCEAELLEKKRQEMENLLQWISQQQEQFSSKLESDYRQEEERRREERNRALQESDAIWQKERDEKIAALEDKLRSMEEEFKANIASQQADMDAQAKELQERQEELSQREDEMESRERNFRRDERRLDSRESSLEDREAGLEEEVNSRFSQKIIELENQLRAKENAYNQLKGSLASLQMECQELQAIKDGFGDNPMVVMNRKLNDLETENQKLRDEVYSRPSAEDKEELERVRERLSRLQMEHNSTKLQMDNMREETERYTMLKSNYDMTVVDKERLERQLKNSEGERQLLQDQINRLTQSAAQASERQARIDSIEKGSVDGVQAPLATENDDAVPKVNEVAWLESIGRNCYDYGFKFPQRILYAFHTALKIADWSTLVVLAGVSGTGKSELPHLYAAFGGLNFMAVPVQPNWDSQESMLGYFNSIDNKFDAQPLLRYLAKCSSEDNDMDKSLNIVLLDEMNLAHVEHYFAEFLSKLELRRDTGRGEEPLVDINIGAGMEPYRLRLTRNILWAGTMNQDETTKSLSDKVLDRGLVINFPRPKELISRQKLMKLEDFVAQRGIQRMDCRIWTQQWVHTELPFSPEQAKYIDENYRTLIQQINDNLAAAGRALGHRVWQSIEFYIANYPLVDEEIGKANGNVTEELKEAIHIAVEDQLVQKCMPKLRGIEVRSNNECLQNILTLLQEKDFNLAEDFNNACNLGYGQFMWNSAEYINADRRIAGEPDQDNASEE